mmetsp:Transcript_46139/g.147631  ORF Transcript_46139/g.147631 Transcript_46139/m.147631 type:complete len:266 (-) Transcript_46139:1686-2483(-)
MLRGELLEPNLGAPLVEILGCPVARLILLLLVVTERPGALIRLLLVLVTLHLHALGQRDARVPLKFLVRQPRVRAAGLDINLSLPGALLLFGCGLPGVGLGAQQLLDGVAAGGEVLIVLGLTARLRDARSDLGLPSEGTLELLGGHMGVDLHLPALELLSDGVTGHAQVVSPPRVAVPLLLLPWGLGAGAAAGRVEGVGMLELLQVVAALAGDSTVGCLPVVRQPAPRNVPFVPLDWLQGLLWDVAVRLRLNGLELNHGVGPVVD